MPTFIPGHRRQPAPPAPAAPSPTSRDGAATEPRIPDAAVQARGGLSNDQKANLSILARRAYDRHREVGLADGSFDEWRHAECRAASGGRIGGFREAMQRDYRLLRGHFANLAGDGATAIQDAIHGDSDEADRGQARAILRRECRRRGHAFPEYPASICRTQYKCGLDEASAKQLWSLIYTVRNRKKNQGARS